MGQVLLHPTERVDTMTTRANQTITIGGIILLLAIMAGLARHRAADPPAPEPLTAAPADDDSADDDDSGRFDHLPEAPKE